MKKNPGENVFSRIFFGGIMCIGMSVDQEERRPEWKNRSEGL